VFAGHFLEHLTPDQARAFLAECHRCLVPGGRLGLVVPDTREIMRRYAVGLHTRVEYPEGTFLDAGDLDAICALFLYSTVQDSPHLWSYDLDTLTRLVEGAGFQVMGEIDRYADPRVSTSRWYQCGVDAVKREG
jgi:hypothetical protein